jgi:N utilization substance protein B
VPFLSRKIARERAFKMLFAIDIGENTIEEASEIVINFLKDENQKLFILSEVRGVLDNLSKKKNLDELVKMKLDKGDMEWLKNI